MYDRGPKVLRPESVMYLLRFSYLFGSAFIYVKMLVELILLCFFVILMEMVCGRCRLVSFGRRSKEERLINPNIVLC